MSQELLLTLHVGAGLLSLSGFALRGAARLLDAQWLKRRAVRVLPHVLDTLLFASGFWLLARLANAPLAQSWFQVKMLALLLYIGLGFVVLRFGRSAPQRSAAYVAALAVAAYLVAAALTRSPLPFA